MARCSGLGGVPDTPRSLETRIMKKQLPLDVLKPGLKLSAPLETTYPLVPAPDIQCSHGPGSPDSI